MRLRTRIITILAICALAFPLMAQDQPAPQPEKKGPFGNLGRCLAIVDLDEFQQQEVRSLIEATAPVLRDLHEQVKADRDVLKEELQSEEPDSCFLGDTMLAVRDGQIAVREEIADLREGIVAILTPEQAAKLAGCLEALGHRREAPGQD